MADEPLLQAFWADVEAAKVSAHDTVSSCPSAHELQQRYPNQLIQYLKQHGVKKLGETRIPATDLPALFGEETLLTRGSASCSFDWTDDWGVVPLDEGPEEEPLLGPRPSLDAAVFAASTSRVRGEGSMADRPLATQSAALPLLSRPWTSRRRSPGPLLRFSSGLLTWAPSFIGARTAARPPANQPTPLPLPPPPSMVVEAYLVAIRDAAAPGEAGLLRPLLRRWQLGSCSESAFGLPAVQAVVHYKWTRYARRLLLKELLMYVLWLGSFTAFMALYNSNDAAVTDLELLSTWQGCVAVACEAVSLLAMLPFAAGEVCIIYAYGFPGWFTAWNMLDCSTYFLQVAITVLHLGRFSQGPLLLMLAVAVQAILLVVRLTYFSRVFKSTTFDLMGSLQTVATDVGWYMAVLLLLMWGFACAFFTIFRDDVAIDSFSSLPMSLLTMLNYAVGGTSYYMRDLLASRHPAAALLLCTVYQFLVSMLLMSLLTGVMTNALMKANQQEAVSLVLNRAQVIDELDTVLPPPLLRLLTMYGGSGSVKPWGPPAAAGPRNADAGMADPWLPYIHVLRVSAKSLDSIDGEERLWPGAQAGVPASASGTSLAQAAGGGGNGGGVGDGEGGQDAGGGGSLHRDGSGPRSGGVPSGERHGPGPGNAVLQRLELRVRCMEGQLSDLQAVMRQLLEANRAVQVMLADQRQQQGPHLGQQAGLGEEQPPPQQQAQVEEHGRQ